ncbi:MAG TPA: PASTA domain-containing protein [Thermoleophilaceae bacterium]|jgi:hypothetical protein
MADVSDFGSDLAAPAALQANHGADTSYWNIGRGVYTAPVEGQVTIVKLKGAVLPNERLRNTDAEKLAQIIHFQVLRPKGDGNLKLVERSTGHLEMPIADSQQAQELVTSYRPVNLCVKRGDIIAFNTIGAHEYRRDPGTPGGPGGAEYQVFGRVPDQASQWYEKDAGLNEGTTIDPSPFPPMIGYELLMRNTLASGPDASDICPGGYSQHIFRGLEFLDHAQPTVKTKTSSIRLKIFCHGENYGSCSGNLGVDATLDGTPTHLGDLKFNVPPTHTQNVDVPVSRANLLKLQLAKSVVGTLTADARDNPRADDRVKWDSVPVQEKTTTDQVTLTPDKPPCVVPQKLIGKSSRSAKAAVRKAGCTAVIKYQRTAKAKEIAKVVKVAPAAGTLLPTASKVTLTIGKRK